MGVSVSSPVATLQWLLTESAKVLETATFIVSLTSIVVSNYATDFNDRAETQIAMAFMDVEGFLSELSTHGELARKCIGVKRTELSVLRNELVLKLTECYESHEKIFSHLQENREKLHAEALRMKTEAEEMIANCTGDIESRFTCLSQGLSKLRRRVKRLVKKVEVQTKKELRERRKILLSLVKCDRRAIKQAHKAVQNVIEDVKKCMFESQSPAVTQNGEPE